MPLSVGNDLPDGTTFGVVDREWRKAAPIIDTGAQAIHRGWTKVAVMVLCRYANAES